MRTMMVVVLIAVVFVALFYFLLDQWNDQAGELEAASAALEEREKECELLTERLRRLQEVFAATEAERNRLREWVDIAHQVRLDLWLDLGRSVDLEQVPVTGRMELLTTDGVLLDLMNHSYHGAIERGASGGGRIHFIFEPIDPGPVTNVAIRHLGTVVSMRESLRPLLDRAGLRTPLTRAYLSLMVNDVYVFERREVLALSSSSTWTEYPVTDLFSRVPEGYSVGLREQYE